VDDDSAPWDRGDSFALSTFFTKVFQLSFAGPKDDVGEVVGDELGRAAASSTAVGR